LRPKALALSAINNDDAYAEAIEQKKKRKQTRAIVSFKE
jgi:hypothetical protein